MRWRSRTRSPAGLHGNWLEARFKKDKLSMIAFTVVVLYITAAILAPFLVKFGVIDPLSLHSSGEDNLLDVSLGGIPKGDFGGISSDHWLGVEPGTGRDVLSRMWYGISFSLAIALSATVLAVAFGTAMGIIAGVSGGFGDATDRTADRPDAVLPVDADVVGAVEHGDCVPHRQPARPRGRHCQRRLCRGGAGRLRLAVCGQADAGAGAVPARARVRRRCAADGRVEVQDLLQGDPAEPVGPADGDLHAHHAGLHLGRGGAELPRGRHQAPDADAGEPAQRPRSAT